MCGEGEKHGEAQGLEGDGWGGWLSAFAPDPPPHPITLVFGHFAGEESPQGDGNVFMSRSCCEK